MNVKILSIENRYAVTPFANTSVIVQIPYRPPSRHPPHMPSPRHFNDQRANLCRQHSHTSRLGHDSSPWSTRSNSQTVCTDFHQHVRFSRLASPGSVACLRHCSRLERFDPVVWRGSQLSGSVGVPSRDCQEFDGDYSPDDTPWQLGSAVCHRHSLSSHVISTRLSVARGNRSLLLRDCFLARQDF